MPAPTGSGKTYSAMEFIYDELVNKRVNKQIIFCSNRVATSVKDPYNDLKSIIEKNCTEKEAKKLKQRVLPLYNDSDQFSIFFKKDWKQILPDAIVGDKKRVKKFNDLKNILDNNSQIDNEIVKSYVRNCKQDIWFYLKIKIDSKKNKNNKNIEKIRKKVFEEEREWLIEVLPSYYFDEFDVVFTTFHKLLYGFDYKTGNKSLIFENINNSSKDILILMDEFDATKSVLLDYLTQRDSIENLIGEFSAISDVRLFSNEHQELNDELKKLASKMKELKDSLHLDDPIKAVGLEMESQFIFKDDEYIFSDRLKGKYKLIYNEQLGRNEIINDSDNSKNGRSIIGVLNQINYFVKFGFPIAVDKISRKYYEKMIKSNRYLERSDALSTVLSRLNIDGELRNRIINRIQLLDTSRNQIYINRDRLRNFYERGFSWFSLHDEESHAEDTHIIVENMRLTPEQVMLYLAKRYRVIGISATAEIKGLRFNYNIDFLKARLGDSFDLLTDEELDLIKSNVISKKSYDNVNIYTTFIDAHNNFDYLIDKLASKWINRERKEEIKEYLKNYFDNSEEKYKYIRTMTICYLFIEFLEKEMDSFIYFGNSSDTLENSFKFIEKIITKWLEDKIENFSEFMPSNHRFNFWKNIGEYGWLEKKVKEAIDMLVSVNAEEYRNKYDNEIVKKERFFIYTTYNSLKEGVNLHYKFNEQCSDVVCIGSLNTGMLKKDIGAIFLEYPTVVFDQMSGENFNLQKEIYNFLSIYHTAWFKGRLENDNSKSADYKRKVLIQQLFKKSVCRSLDCNKRRSIIKNFYEKYLPEYFAFDIASLVKQTIGRICRSNYKNRNIYIYLDNFYKKHLLRYAKNSLSGRILHLKEFDEVINEAKKDDNEPNSNLLTDDFSIYTVQVNKKGKYEIEDMIKIFKDENSQPALIESAIKNWKDLRKLVLLYPTLPNLQDVKLQDNIVVSPPQYIYTKSNSLISKYWYKGSHEEIKDASESEELEHEVSDALVKKICLINEIKEFMNENSYPVEWDRGAYIISPIMFNNIYKGALGEEIGIYILEKYLKIDIEELDSSEFELFDGKTKSGVYIDFKTYSFDTANNLDSNSEVKRRVLEKLKSNPHIKKVLIAGLIGDSDHRIKFFTEKFTKEENIDRASIVVIPNLLNVAQSKVSSALTGENADILKGWIKS